MFDFTSEQIEKRKLAESFAQKLFNKKDNKELPNSDLFKSQWKECSNFGLFILPVPKKYGGLEEELLSVFSIMEGIGSGSDEVGIMFSVNVHIWACLMPIIYFGTEEQKDKYLPDLMSGAKIGAHAISEESAGSDVWNFEATYEETSDGYKLNGIKNYVTNAPYADVFIVYARKKGSKGIKGVSCFIIDRGTEGFVIGNAIDKMGMELSPISSIYMNGCIVPKSNLLGKMDQGMNIFNYTMEYERTFLFSFQIGLMERQLKKCVEFAKKRKQFNERIINFQSVSNRIADMKVRLEGSKLFTYKVIHEKIQNKNSFLSSSIAKLYISESLVQNSMSAMEIFGAAGYCKEFGIEKYLRDSMGSKFYSGTSDIQRNIISGLI